MTPPSPTRAFLAAQVRWAMGRGLPPQAAEDVVFEAWEKAATRFDPKRGSFEAFMQKVVRTDCAMWWRQQHRHRQARVPLQLLPSEQDSLRAERAVQNQETLLEQLSPEEHRVFCAWALQKHLGKGAILGEQVARSIGLEPGAYENAKRRLRDRLPKLLDRLGWSVADLLHGETDVDRTG